MVLTRNIMKGEEDKDILGSCFRSISDQIEVFGREVIIYIIYIIYSGIIES